MQLAELQSAFRDAVLARRTETIVPWIDAGAIDAEVRLAVYRVNVLENLTAALTDCFPAVQALVGEECFRSLCRAFIAAHPPKAACLLWYGEDFSAFIAQCEAVRGLPYLADVARFEWGWHCAYCAEDDVPLDPVHLASLNEATLEAVRLTLCHSVTLLDSDWPIHSVWHFARHPDETETPPDIHAGGMQCALWRPEREVCMLAVNAAEFAALTRCAEAQGATLAELIAAAEQQQPGHDAAVLLEKLFALHILRVAEHGEITNTRDKTHENTV